MENEQNTNKNIIAHNGAVIPTTIFQTLNINLSFDGSEIDSVMSIISFLKYLESVLNQDKDFDKIKILKIYKKQIDVFGDSPNQHERQHRFQTDSLPVYGEDKNYIRSFLIYKHIKFGITVGGKNAIKEDLALDKLIIKMAVDIEYDTDFFKTLANIEYNNIVYDKKILAKIPSLNNETLVHCDGIIIGLLLYMLSDNFSEEKAEKLFEPILKDIPLAVLAHHKNFLNLLLSTTFIKLNDDQRAEYSNKIVEHLSSPAPNIVDTIGVNFLKYLCRYHGNSILQDIHDVLFTIFPDAADGNQVTKSKKYRDREAMLLCEAFWYLDFPSADNECIAILKESINHLFLIARNKLNASGIRTAALNSSSNLLLNSKFYLNDKLIEDYKDLLNDLYGEQDKLKPMTLSIISCLPKLSYKKFRTDIDKKEFVERVKSEMDKPDSDFGCIAIIALADYLKANLSNKLDYDLFNHISRRWLNTDNFKIRRQCALFLIDLILIGYNPAKSIFSKNSILPYSNEIKRISDLISVDNDLIGSILKQGPEFQVDLPSLILASILEKFDLVLRLNPFLSPAYKNHNLLFDISTLCKNYAKAEIMAFSNEVDLNMLAKEYDNIIVHITSETTNDYLKKYWIKEAIEIRKKLIIALKSGKDFVNGNIFSEDYTQLITNVESAELKKGPKDLSFAFHPADKRLLSFLTKTTDFIFRDNRILRDSDADSIKELREIILKSYSINLISAFNKYVKEKDEEINESSSMTSADTVEGNVGNVVTQLIKNGIHKTYYWYVIKYTRKYLKVANCVLPGLNIRLIGLLKIAKNHSF